MGKMGWISRTILKLCECITLWIFSSFMHAIYYGTACSFLRGKSPCIQPMILLTSHRWTRYRHQDNNNEIVCVDKVLWIKDRLMISDHTYEDLYTLLDEPERMKFHKVKSNRDQWNAKIKTIFKPEETRDGTRVSLKAGIIQILKLHNKTKNWNNGLWGLMWVTSVIWGIFSKFVINDFPSCKESVNLSRIPGRFWWALGKLAKPTRHRW